MREGPRLKSHVYRLAREGRIPCVELGRYKRFRLDAIERFELGDESDIADPREAA